MTFAVKQRNGSGLQTPKKKMKFCGNARRQKDALYAMMDIATYAWFVDQRLQGTPISGPIICVKALKFYDLLYPQLPVGKVPFKASEGWLCRFKDRHGIHCLKVQGEKLSADTSVISWYVKSLKGKIEERLLLRQLCPEQIHNAGKLCPGKLSSQLLKVQPLVGESQKTE